MLIEMAVGGILFVLIIWNRVMIYKSKKRRIIMCRLNNRRIMLGFTPVRADWSNDLFLNQSVLKMHNTGTDLEEETEQVKFVPIADARDYFGKLRL